jgi:hypothetical protein
LSSSSPSPSLAAAQAEPVVGLSAMALLLRMADAASGAWPINCPASPMRLTWRRQPPRLPSGPQRINPEHPSEPSGDVVGAAAAVDAVAAEQRAVAALEAALGMPLPEAARRLDQGEGLVVALVGVPTAVTAAPDATPAASLRTAAASFSKSARASTCASPESMSPPTTTTAAAAATAVSRTTLPPDPDAGATPRFILEVQVVLESRRSQAEGPSGRMVCFFHITSA